VLVIEEVIRSNREVSERSKLKYSDNENESESESESRGYMQ